MIEEKSKMGAAAISVAAAPVMLRKGLLYWVVHYYISVMGGLHIKCSVRSILYARSFSVNFMKGI